MMVNTWLQIAFLCATFARLPQAQQVEARIDIKNTSPERILAVLAPPVGAGKGSVSITLPLGLKAIKADAAGSALLVTGTPKQIGEIREMVRLLDVSPKKLWLHVRVIRLERASDKLKEEILSDLRSTTVNNAPILISSSDILWESEGKVLPRINGDGSISLKCDFRLLINGIVNSTFAPAVKRIHPGDTIMISYARASSNETFVDLEDPKPGTLGRTGYRLEVTVKDLESP